MFVKTFPHSVGRRPLRRSNTNGMGSVRGAVYARHRVYVSEFCLYVTLVGHHWPEYS